MPVKFSSLETKSMKSTNKLVGLYNDEDNTYNCLVNSSEIALNNDVNNKINELLVKHNEDMNDIKSSISVNDMNGVHKTGNETIGGNKSFTSPIIVNNSGKGVFYGNHIEFSPTTSSTNGGYIDFHYAGSTEDYTSRIIESASGQLQLNAKSILGVTPSSKTDSSTKIPTTKWVNDRIVDIINSNKVSTTRLFTGPHGSGNITLSQPFTNFPFIDIYGGNDNKVQMTWWRIPSSILDNMLKSTIKIITLMPGSGSLYWDIYNYANGSSTTLFKVQGENTVIHWIDGIRYTY